MANQPSNTNLVTAESETKSTIIGFSEPFTINQSPLRLESESGKSFSIPDLASVHFFPTTWLDKDSQLQRFDAGAPDHIKEYLKLDFDVSRLVKVYKHLWLAGRMSCIRPLHYQIYLQRKIVITERADMHGLWHKNDMYLKPLPNYLLHPDCWSNHICADRELHAAVVGFMLTYLSLISRPSDLTIARNTGLLDQSISWERWNEFAGVFADAVDYQSLQNVNVRYQYGELRLGRLNWIYRLSKETFGVTTFFRGYRFGYNKYSNFLYDNFAWLLAAFAYVTIALTAMQVGLATHQLADNTAFNRASYGFTVFSVLAPIVVCVIMAAVVGIFFIFNWAAARSHQNAVQQYRKKHTAGP